jgi:hypothetical protein
MASANRSADTLTQRVSELEAELMRTREAERQQRLRADALEASSRTAWRFATGQRRRENEKGQSD